MIELIKTKFLEIILKIESAIISTIQNNISKLINTGIPFESNCIYDAAIFGGKENIVSGKIIMSLGDEESISERKGIIFLTLDEESFELINFLLEKKRSVERYGPEICELPVKGKKKEFTLILGE